MNVVDDVGDDVGDDEELFEFAQTHPLLFCSVCCIKDPGRVDRLAYEYWRNLMRERGLRS
jgi:hypothetical protein